MLRPRSEMAADAVVISQADLLRIKSCVGLSNTLGASTGGLGAEAAQYQATKLKARDLHGKSQARAKTWSNTLEGSRRKKAEEKRKKLELEELDRQKLDSQEAKIQLDQRKATIDRANKLLYDESDRMKSFHSKMMLCDVLAEREAQMSLKGELKKLEQIREDRFLEMEKQNYRKMLEREMKEKETKEELSRLAAKVQKEQLGDYMEKRFREVEDDQLEGELLRRKAIEDLESEKMAEGKRRETQVKALSETTKANDYLKQIKAEDVLRQLREEDKIAEYAARKERMLQLRKNKEDEVFQAKQGARNQMIAAQGERLAAMANGEEQRVESQVKEKEAGDERKRIEKEQTRRRFEQEMARSRAAQIERKRNERDRSKAEDADTAKFLGEWCKVLDKQEKEESELKDIAARKLSAEHQKMAHISRLKTNKERTVDETVCLRAKKAMEADTMEFHNYAESVIRGYCEEGKNVLPLIKELRDFRKRVLD